MVLVYQHVCSIHWSYIQPFKHTSECLNVPWSLELLSTTVYSHIPLWPFSSTKPNVISYCLGSPVHPPSHPLTTSRPHFSPVYYPSSHLPFAFIRTHSSSFSFFFNLAPRCLPFPFRPPWNPLYLHSPFHLPLYLLLFPPSFFHLFSLLSPFSFSPSSFPPSFIFHTYTWLPPFPFSSSLAHFSSSNLTASHIHFGLLKTRFTSLSTLHTYTFPRTLAVSRQHSVERHLRDIWRGQFTASSSREIAGRGEKLIAGGWEFRYVAAPEGVSYDAHCQLVTVGWQIVC